MYFGAAVKYWSAYGNLDVARTCKTEEGTSLGSWIQTRKSRGNKLKFGNHKIMSDYCAS